MVDRVLLTFCSYTSFCSYTKLYVVIRSYKKSHKDDAVTHWPDGTELIDHQFEPAFAQGFLRLCRRVHLLICIKPELGPWIPKRTSLVSLDRGKNLTTPLPYSWSLGLRRPRAPPEQA